MLQITGRSRYLKLIVGLLVLSSVATLIIDFQFKVIVQDTFHTADRMTVFFGTFYAWLGFFSFILQIFAGRWIIDNFGVRLTLLALPIALLSGTVILLAFPLHLWTGLLLKGSDGAIRYTIDKSTIELLYMPIPDNVKAELKAVLDMVVQRIADGLGGLLLLFLIHILGFDVINTGIFNMVVLGAWIWTAFQTRQEYVSSLRANLAERRIIPELAMKAAFRDRESLGKIRSMMRESDEEVVLYAIDLAIAIGHDDLIPADLLRHPSRKVRYKALDTISIEEGEFRNRLRDEPDSAVRAKILSRGCSTIGASGIPESPREHLDSDDIRIRLAAVACLANGTPEHDQNTVRDYQEKAIGKLDESSDEWSLIAEMIGEIHHPAVVQLHSRLMLHPSRDIRKNAIVAAGRSGHRELVPILVQLLASREYSAIARKALHQYKGRILGTLADILMDPEENLEIRRQIPLIIDHIPSQNTVNILNEALADEDGLLRFRAIKALNQLRISGPAFDFDTNAISNQIALESEKTLWYRHALNVLYPENGHRDLLAQLLRDKIGQGRERVFRLLGLILPPTAAHAAYKAIVEEKGAPKANALEYLDNALSLQLKKMVMQLMDTRKKFFKDRMPEILESFSQSTDPVLRECTLDAAAKNRWPLSSSTSEA